MDKVRVSFYNENSAKNAVLVEINKPEANTKLEIYFSYSTPIAFGFFDNGKIKSNVVSKNEWGTTSGKHINLAEKRISINDTKRIDHSAFMVALEHICERYGFSMPEIDITGNGYGR